MVDDFNTQMQGDLDNIFLKELSVPAIFETSTNISTVKVQFFYSDLDKLETIYTYAWGKFDDFSYVKKNDYLTINNIKYGIVDYSHDEFKHTTTLFLQEV